MTNSEDSQAGSDGLPRTLGRRPVIRTLHRWVGIAGVLVFLGTGVYMRVGLPGIIELGSATRMMFRSRHIYLLLTSLLNLALGTYVVLRDRPWRWTLQVAGSVLILAGPPLLLAAFFREPSLSELQIPFSKPAIIGAVVGVLLHAVAGARIQAERDDDSRARHVAGAERERSQ